MKITSAIGAYAIRAILIAAYMLAGPQAYAGPIVGAVNAIVETGNPSLPGTFISDTYNQNGLLDTYVSGVTDFDTYIASGPRHVYPFIDAEWFSDYAVSTISVVYDLGSLWDINAVALWNEDMGGIGQFDLYYSQDNLNFFDLALGLVPTDNTLDENYLPSVFNFAPTSARYIRLVGSACPGVPEFDYDGCTLAEIAFGTVTPLVAEVDEPAAALLMSLGMLSLAIRRRQRSRMLPSG